MSLTYEGDWETVGRHLADVFTLPDTLRHLVNWMMRRGEVNLTEVVTHIGQDESVARAILDRLVAQDFVQVMESKGEPHYQPRLAPRRGRKIPQGIWQALDQSGEKSTRPSHVSPQTGAQVIVRRVREAILSEPGRFWVAASSVVLVFLVAEWLLLTGTASFARVLSFAGVIGNSLTAGIFPVLLLISSRRKGDFVPGVVYWFLDHPLVTTGIYLLFLTNLFLHTLVIWQNPLERGCAMLFGLLVVGSTIVMVRRGALTRCTVVELREDQGDGGRAVFGITAAGQPATTEVRLEYAEGEQQCQAASGDVPAFASLHYAIFQIPATQAQELKVWAHTVTPEGELAGPASTSGGAVWCRNPAV
jgi:hypothetical protein